MQKILVIQTAFLGDIVLTIPLLLNIKKKFTKTTKLYVLTAVVGNEVLKFHDFIDKIIIYDKKGIHKGLKNFLRFIKFIKQEKFDLAIIPHKSFRSTLLAFLSKIPNRWGFTNSEGFFFLTKKILYNKKKHDLERNLDLLRAANLKESLDTSIDFPEVSEIEKKTEAVLKEKGFLCKVIVGINPSSNWATKKWPAEKYVNITKELLKRDCKIIIFGDNKDKNLYKIFEKEFVNNEDVLNLLGKTNIQELISFIRYLSIYVTNDSGPMHIAAALSIPIVAIFGPTTTSLGFYPYTKKAIIVQKDLACRPCGKHGPNKCPILSHACMKKITESEVLNAVTDLLLTNIPS
jgi:heptosyltransferase II